MYDGRRDVRRECTGGEMYDERGDVRRTSAEIKRIQLREQPSISGERNRSTRKQEADRRGNKVQVPFITPCGDT